MAFDAQVIESAFKPGWMILTQLGSAKPLACAQNCSPAAERRSARVSRMNVINLAEARARRQARTQARAGLPVWRPRVLVVAEDAEWRSALRACLQDQPYDVEVMPPPAEWSSLAARRPDVVLLDLDPPRQRLLRQACQLKRSVIGRFVPVIGVGGNASGSHRRAFAAGIDQWLAKPATREETRLEVLSALRARQNYRLLLERD